MEKIWIITIEKNPCSNSSKNLPRAYKNEKVALEAFEELKEAIKTDYADDIERQILFFGEGENWAGVYADDYQYTVELSCVSLQ